MRVVLLVIRAVHLRPDILTAVSKSIATSFIANSLVKNSILQPRIDVAVWIDNGG